MRLLLCIAAVIWFVNQYFMLYRQKDAKTEAKFAVDYVFDFDADKYNQGLAVSLKVHSHQFAHTHLIAWRTD